jgi:hypothetical protein
VAWAFHCWNDSFHGDHVARPLPGIRWCVRTRASSCRAARILSVCHTAQYMSHHGGTAASPTALDLLVLTDADAAVVVCWRVLTGVIRCHRHRSPQDDVDLRRLEERQVIELSGLSGVWEILGGGEHGQGDDSSSNGSGSSSAGHDELEPTVV